MYKVVTGFVCEGHNNCELPVGIYNICDCLVWVGRRCSARSVLTSVIDMFMFL